MTANRPARRWPGGRASWRIPLPPAFLQGCRSAARPAVPARPHHWQPLRDWSIAKAL